MSVTIQDISRTLVNGRLLTVEELEMAISDLGSPTADELLGHLERCGRITSYQAKKAAKGDAAGFYYGRFMVMYQIAAGSFGRVYRALDPETGEGIALKVLRRRHAENPEAVEQFDHEWDLGRRLSHLNIIRVIEGSVDAATGARYHAMEFIEGGNFREFINIRKKFSPDEMLPYAIQIAEGLAHAHSRGVTHRDVKPTNLLISTDGTIKWIDFGLGGTIEEVDGKPVYKSTQRSVDYAGLEKATNVPRGDPRSDIFFLGAIFYQMLSGDPPMLETKDRFARMYASRFKNIAPLEMESSIPSSLSAVVDRMLAFSPSERFQDMASVVESLRAIEKGDDIHSAGASDSSNETQVGTQGDSSAGAGQPRVMIVHRDARVQDILREKLAKHGYHVALTSDIDRALALFRLRPAECVIIDLATTGEQGIAAFESMSDTASIHQIPCGAIFLADPSEEQWTKELDASTCVTLRKPARLGPVYESVKRIAPRPTT